MTVMRMRTVDLAKNDRFDYWYQAVCAAHARALIEVRDRSDFDAAIELRDIGAARLFILRYPALQARRPTRLIRQSDPELLHLTITTRGAVEVSQLARNVTADPTSLVMYDTSRPCFATTRAPVTQLVLQLPRALVTPPGLDLDPVLATAIDARCGAGGMLSYLMRDIAAHPQAYPPALAARFATIVSDLILSLLARRAVPGAVPQESRTRVLRTRVLRFIETRLGDPALDAATVAQAHQLSLRQLNRNLQDTGLTVSAWIRQQRLERCRRDLADATQSARPVQAIGARWGFPDAAAFSRTFRREFGSPPGEYRRRLVGLTDTDQTPESGPAARSGPGIDASTLPDAHTGRAGRLSSANVTSGQVHG
jgi:AraC-like DNA-binding protein